MWYHIKARDMGIFKPNGICSPSSVTTIDENNEGWTMLNTDKWKIPEQQRLVCKTDKKCPVCQIALI